MSINISQQYDGLFVPPIQDNSMDEYKYIKHLADEAITTTATNYKITIRDVDSWHNLSQGFVEVKCHATLSNGVDFPNNITDDLALENNACNLFERTELRFGDQKVDQTEYTGLTTLIKGLKDNSKGWEQSIGESMNWIPDTNNTINYEEFNTTADEGFTSRNDNYNEGYNKRRNNTLAAVGANKKVNTFLIPLRKLFPILADFRNPVKGIRTSVHLWRNKDVNILVRNGVSGSANDFKLQITDLNLWVPTIVPTLEKSVELDTKFAKGMTIPINWDRCETIVSTPFSANSSAQSYRLATLSEKPVRIYVGFQRTFRLNHTDQTTTSMIFDNLNLEYLSAKINSKTYPEEIYNPEWNEENYTREYLDFVGDSLDLSTGTSLSFNTYKNVYPLYQIDCSSMPESVFNASSTADIVLKFKLRSTPTNNYHLVAIIESEASLQLQPVSADRVKLEQ